MNFVFAALHGIYVCIFPHCGNAQLDSSRHAGMHIYVESDSLESRSLKTPDKEEENSGQISQLRFILKPSDFLVTKLSCDGFSLFSVAAAASVTQVTQPTTYMLHSLRRTTMILRDPIICDGNLNMEFDQNQ
jgi:hypothetical protein